MSKIGKKYNLFSDGTTKAESLYLALKDLEKYSIFIDEYNETFNQTTNEYDATLTLKLKSDSEALISWFSTLPNNSFFDKYKTLNTSVNFTVDTHYESLMELKNYASISDSENVLQFESPLKYNFLVKKYEDYLNTNSNIEETGLPYFYEVLKDFIVYDDVLTGFSNFFETPNNIVSFRRTNLKTNFIPPSVTINNNSYSIEKYIDKFFIHKSQLPFFTDIKFDTHELDENSIIKILHDKNFSTPLMQEFNKSSVDSQLYFNLTKRLAESPTLLFPVPMPKPILNFVQTETETVIPFFGAKIVKDDVNLSISEEEVTYSNEDLLAINNSINYLVIQLQNYWNIEKLPNNKKDAIQELDKQKLVYSSINSDYKYHENICNSPITIFEGPSIEQKTYSCERLKELSSRLTVVNKYIDALNDLIKKIDNIYSSYTPLPTVSKISTAKDKSKILSNINIESLINSVQNDNLNSNNQTDIGILSKQTDNKIEENFQKIANLENRIMSDGTIRNNLLVQTSILLDKENKNTLSIKEIDVEKFLLDKLRSAVTNADFTFISLINQAIENKSRTFLSVLLGQDEYIEVIGYRLKKTEANEETGISYVQSIQEWYFPNTFEGKFNWVDSQIKYNKLYSYKLDPIVLTFATDFKINSIIKESDNTIKINFNNKPKLKAYVLNGEVNDETRTLGATYINKLLDFPPIEPEVEVIPFIGVDKQIKLNFNTSVGKKTVPFIAFNSLEYDNIKKLQKAQNKSPNNDLLTFASDEPSEEIELYRIDNKPKTYEEFFNKKLVSISTDGTSAASFLDNILPNKKYYYIARCKDYHGNISNPTPIYEVEILSENGLIIPNISLVSLDKQENKKQTSKSFKRYLKIQPAAKHRIVNDENVKENDIELGDNTVKPWDKNFKLRLISKSTGKKIDINFKFKYKKAFLTSYTKFEGQVGSLTERKR